MKSRTSSCLEIINKITEEWFLTEPLLFSVFCTHRLVQNDSLHIPMRTGKGRIEFSAPIIASLGKNDVEQYLRVEVIRILLKHPYQRQPSFAVPTILTYASNYTICDSMCFTIPLEGVTRWNFEKGLCFEEYYVRILEELKKDYTISDVSMQIDHPDCIEDENSSVSEENTQAEQQLQLDNVESQDSKNGVKTDNGQNGSCGADDTEQTNHDAQAEHRSQFYASETQNGYSNLDGNCRSGETVGNEKTENDTQTGMQSQPVSPEAKESNDNRCQTDGTNESSDDAQTQSDSSEFQGDNCSLENNCDSTNEGKESSNDESQLTDDMDFEGSIENINQSDFEEDFCFEEYYALYLDQKKSKQTLPDNNGQTVNHQKSDKEEKGDNNSSQSNDTNLSNNDAQMGCYSQRCNPESQSRDDAQESYKKTSLPSYLNVSETSALWKEDNEQEIKINELIENAENSNSWGTVAGDLRQKIIAAMHIAMNYRKMLSFYRTSILSSKRHLTRMRPSRRYGFSAMGSRYELKSNLLVAVDVSGSISDKSLAVFYSVVNRFFQYGIEKIDVIQFDTELKGMPISLKKARREISVVGRGGTDFEPALSFCVSHTEYDGFIIFTDGYAPIPDLSGFPLEILWVLDSYESYNDFLPRLEEAKKHARNRITYIPLPAG